MYLFVNSQNRGGGSGAGPRHKKFIFKPFKTGRLLSLRGSGNEILANKFSKTDCRNFVI